MPRRYFLFQLLLVGLLVVGCETSAEVAREIRGVEPQMTVSASDLLGDYEANEVAADLKYKDKVVLITGVIDRFVSGEEAKVYFDTGSGFTEVTCGFSSEEAVSVAELKKGQQITFRGKVTGKGLFDVEVKGCTVTATQTTVPTPNIARTVAAAVLATTEAVPSATPVPTPTETLQLTPAPIVEPKKTPKPISAPTQLPTKAPSPTPTPTSIPTPTPTSMPAPTSTPTVAMLLADMISVSLIGKQILPVNYDLNRYSEEVQFTFTFQNISDKEIRAFTGIAIFSDIFDRPIKSISITYDESLRAGQPVTWKGVWDPNQFIDEDQQLVNSELNNLVFLFKTKAVIFTDGSRLGTDGGTNTPMPGSALPTPTPAPTPIPTNYLDLRPGAGPPGTLVKVIGVGFTAGNSPLSELKIGDIDIRPIPVPSTGPGAILVTMFIVPNLPPGINIVQATVGTVTIKSPFTVSDPSPTP